MTKCVINSDIYGTKVTTWVTERECVYERKQKDYTDNTCRGAYIFMAITSVLEVDAATNKALRVKATIPKVSGLDKITDYGKSTTFVLVASKKKAKYKKGGTLSYTEYIPKDMLSKNGAVIQLQTWVDVYKKYEADMLGTIMGR
ncbi:MAG: hypothetical protein K6E13_09435 [Lachnospiraceae bacterium]|nr:hypothetical protein [Lachnospiraceae bacterium]